MKLARAHEMRNIDRRAMDELGVGGLFLMENAGRGVASAVKKRWGEVRGMRIGVLCGKGNNGGDGFVTARYLLGDGAWVEVALLGRTDELRGDPKVNMERWRALGKSTLEVGAEGASDALRSFLSGKDLVVDAVFGTGLERKVEGLPAEAVRKVNDSGIPVVSIDIPSGVSSDTGEVMGVAVEAAMTVTLALPKLGLFLYPGASHAGEVQCVDIGIPERAIRAEKLDYLLFELGDAAALFPRRKPDAHKGDCGKIWLLGGSVGLTGAVAMASESAVRVGAGLVTAAVPASLNDILEAKLTEVMTCPLPDTPERALAADAGDRFIELAAQADVIAVGPGLSRNESALEAARRVVEKTDKPVVLDADGINAFQDHLDILERRTGETVITPHPGEMARLTGMEIAKVEAERTTLPLELASRLGITVVLKGSPTVTATPDGRAYVNSSGNAGLATGGTGDVLTGTIAGLAGQGLSLDEAAPLGVFLHGLAGDIAAGRKSQWGMSAVDVIAALPDAIREVTD